MLSLFKRAPRFDKVVARYLASAAFKQLAKATQQKRMWLLPILVARFGTRRVNRITPQDVEDMMSAEAHRPGTANNLLSLLRGLLAKCLRDGEIKRDPTIHIKALKMGHYHTWSETEIALFEKRWPRGGTEVLEYRPTFGRRGKRLVSGAMVRLAFDLFLWTDQRRADIAKMAWSDIYAARLEVVQQKTGAVLSLPFHAQLVEAVAGLPRGNGTILMTPTGRSFTAAELGYVMTAAIRATGLPARCVPHGLRKATLRRIAEKGGTGKMMNSVSGHNDLRNTSVYTAAADQKLLSDQAFGLLLTPTETTPRGT